jgi:hypothetical protein
MLELKLNFEKSILDNLTLKEKIEGVIRNSVTNREEVIQVLEDILRERKSANSMRDRLRK